MNFIYSSWDNDLLLYDQGWILSKEQVEYKLGKKYDRIRYNPSPDLSSLMIKVWDNRPGWTEYIYLSSMDFEGPTMIASGRPVATWSPDSRMVLVIADNFMHVINRDGRGRTPIGQRSPRDGYPAWSHDGSRLYWTKNGKLRVIDASTGISELLEVDWLEDWLQIFNLQFSPRGDKLAFENGNSFYITNSDFTEPLIISPGTEEGLLLDIYGFVWSPDGNMILAEIALNDPYCTSNCSPSRDLYLIDSTNGEFSDISMEMLGVEKLNSYFTKCGFTPDGKNIVIDSDGYLYFFDFLKEEIALTLVTNGGCPIWLSPELPNGNQLLTTVEPIAISDGSLLPFLDSNKTIFMGSIVQVDNLQGDEWLSFDSIPLRISHPFSITVQFEAVGERSSLMVSGRTDKPWGEWWDGVHRMYIHAEDGRITI